MQDDREGPEIEMRRDGFGDLRGRGYSSVGWGRIYPMYSALKYSVVVVVAVPHVPEN